MNCFLEWLTYKRRQNLLLASPTGIYLLYWRRSVVFIVNFEYISHLILVFLLLTLNM